MRNSGRFSRPLGRAHSTARRLWFKKFHHERLPSALDRYVKEANRVTALLEGHLTRQREALGEEAIQSSAGSWLVRNKYSYADLALVSWQLILPMLVSKEDGLDLSKYPAMADWVARMSSRDAVKYGMGTSEELK